MDAPLRDMMRMPEATILEIRPMVNLVATNSFGQEKLVVCRRNFRCCLVNSRAKLLNFSNDTLRLGFARSRDERLRVNVDSVLNDDFPYVH